MHNYDRANQHTDFELATERVVIFTNAAGNGMTNFLYNELQNKPYIFVQENFKNDIIFDSADSNTTEKLNNRNTIWDNIINIEKTAQYATNLLYFVPQFGTYLRNKYHDAFNELLKTANDIKYSFTEFLGDYFKMQPNDTIYVIAEHVEQKTNCFVQKLKDLIDMFPNVRLILTCDYAIPRAQIVQIFNGTFTAINFSKPPYNTAKEIFDGLQMDERIYTREMYDHSSNLIDFFGKYQTELQKHAYYDPQKRVISLMLKFIDCPFNITVFEKLCEYSVVNKMLSQDTDMQQLLNELIRTGNVSRKGDVFYYNLAKVSPKDNIIFKAFAGYLLDNYHDINIEMLYFILKLYPDLFTMEIALYAIYKCKNEKILSLLVEIIKKNHFKNFEEYCSLYNYLFNLKLFELIPPYQQALDDNEKNKYKLLETIAREKSHLHTSPSIYKKNIKQNIEKNCDFACLNEILLMDYAINHDRKFIQQILNPHSVFHFEKLKGSKYYYILQNIMAYYVDDEKTALNFYNNTIQKAPKNERFLLINNKFAYLISLYQVDLRYKAELEATFNELLTDYQDAQYSFIEHNIMLYKSLINEKNEFSTPNQLTTDRTWELYKKLNSLVCDYVFGTVDLQKYIDMESEIKNSNRFPTCSFYYYNLYLIAKDYGNKNCLKTAKRFLEKNKQFTYTALGKKYNKIKNSSVENIRNNKREFVKFGLIFSRLFDLNYLLLSLEEVTK